MISVRLQSFLIVALFSESVAQLSFVTPPHIGATVSFSENQPVGTALYTIQANDPAGNPPIYTVLNSTCESSQVTPVFNISSTDQLVVPAEGLDAEECSKYTFTFRVSAGTSTLDSGPLTILVTDINDNAPTFNKSSYSGEVWKTDKKGQIVNNDAIIATDPDVSKLPVILSISGAQTTFAIYQNGSVYVNDMSGLASLASPTVLTIQASDGGLTSTALLTIIVHEDPCTSSPCQNGGTCNSTRPTRQPFSCSCVPGYTGINCENVNYCYIRPCKQGTCKNLQTSYVCDCYQCVTGFNCTLPDPNCTPPTDTTPTTNPCLWVGITVTCACLVCIGGCAVYFVCKEQKKKDRRKCSQDSIQMH